MSYLPWKQNKINYVIHYYVYSNYSESLRLGKLFTLSTFSPNCYSRIKYEANSVCDNQGNVNEWKR